MCCERWLQRHRSDSKMSSHRKNPELIVYFVQRLTGVILFVLLLIHLLTIIIAVQGELTVAEIVNRVRGNTVWFSFYGLFIVTAVIHAAIGLSNVISELSNFGERIVRFIVGLYSISSLTLGYFALRSIW